MHAVVKVETGMIARPRLIFRLVLKVVEKALPSAVGDAGLEDSHSSFWMPLA